MLDWQKADVYTHHLVHDESLWSSQHLYEYIYGKRESLPTSPLLQVLHDV